jgi:hypothetical protein
VIAPERIERIALIVERAGLSETTLSALRESFADLHFTYCMDEDIGAGIGTAAPVHDSLGFRIYLVDGRSQCLSLTGDPESATGLLLAECEPQCAPECDRDPRPGRA